MKRFSKLGFAIFLNLIFFCPQFTFAHDGWVEITPTIVEKGQPTTIALIQGNHSNEHKSYRIAGKWDGKNTTLAVVNPAGKLSTLTDRVIDLGEDEEKVGPKGPKGFLPGFVRPERRRALSGRSPVGAQLATGGRAQARHSADRQDGIRGLQDSHHFGGKKSKGFRPAYWRRRRRGIHPRQ